MLRIFCKQLALRNLNHSRSSSHFITTPIFYANSSPHIGHVHTLLLADALNLYQRLKLNDDDTIFSSGTDEHGIKIQTAAEAAKQTYQQFCDLNSERFRTTFEEYDTTLTDFIRTSGEQHKSAVGHVWTELDRKGFIYKSEYSGWYCNSDETFVPASQVIIKEINGEKIHLDQNNNEVVWLSENNYMFKLSEVIDRVEDWLTNQKPVVPEKFNTEAIAMVRRGDIGDISISRPAKRLSWGIKVPNDPSQTVYVWLDALTNYLTIAGYPCPVGELKRWPIDCQVIGKDIIKFHAIYWPAFLIALSLPLPKKLICHSHWLIDSLKMSKSRGNVVDPREEINLTTIEGLRYYLLRSATTHSDTDYSRTQAFRKVNAELADTYGNLLSRCCGKTINPQQVITTKLVDPAKPLVLELINRLSQLPEVCEKHYENADFYKAVDQIMAVLRLNNALYEESMPWKLVKEIEINTQASADYSNLQTITFETLRICSILLQPVIPKLSALALNRMNVMERTWSDTKLIVEFGDSDKDQRAINQNAEAVLFRRLKIVE